MFVHTAVCLKLERDELIFDRLFDTSVHVRQMKKVEGDVLTACDWRIYSSPSPFHVFHQMPWRKSVLPTHVFMLAEYLFDSFLVYFNDLRHHTLEEFCICTIYASIHFFNDISVMTSRCNERVMQNVLRYVETFKEHVYHLRTMSKSHRNES